MNKKIIVSSSDEKYFNLINELFSSIKLNGLLNEYDFGILDTGLNSDQKILLKDSGAIIIEAKWNSKVPNYKVRSRDHLKTQFARAFLPDYFPEL